MKERIRELAEQAGLVIEVGEDEDASEVFDEAVEYISNSYDIDLKKFAELIVRECVSIVEAQKESLCDDDSDWSDYDFGYHDAVIDSVDMIKQKFGVEE